MAAYDQDVHNLFSLSFVKRTYQDTTYILGAPARWNTSDWLNFSLAVGAIGASATLDRPVRDISQRNTNITLDNISNNKGIRPLGEWGAFGVLGAFYIGGVALKDDNARDVALDGLDSSLIAAGIISTGLKYAVGRARPYQGEGVYHFNLIIPRSLPQGNSLLPGFLYRIGAFDSHSESPIAAILRYF